MEGVIGFITLFGGTFAPRNWQLCNGQTISIASNTALFSILGTNYGGNGTTNFQLPNMQGRVAIGQGQGPGLSFYNLGQSGGVETVTLTTAQMPAHVHPVPYNITQNSSTGATTAIPTGKSYGNDNGGGTPFAAPANVALKPFPGNLTMTNAGNGFPIGIQNPYLALNYIICQFGVFPARN